MVVWWELAGSAIGLTLINVVTYARNALRRYERR